jgi:rod shape-determining protein MreC
MESFLNRYRNITVLLLVLFGQVLLLAVQVKNEQQVRLIRLWTVTAVTPMARLLESLRGGGAGVLRDYVLLRDVHQENRRLHGEVDRLRLENNFLENEIRTADRAKALLVFQSRTQSKTLAARVIGTGAGVNSKLVFLDRGSVEGVMRGMAVVTPDGIVGKVIAAYPTASAVILATDAEFAAGVVGQKHQARGTLKGQGTSLCKVDYVPPEQKVEPGEMFYTSGDDRIFPRGFPVGVARAVRPAAPYQDIQVALAGLEHGVEAVLILLQGVHEAIPESAAAAASSPVYIAPAPPAAPQGELPASVPGQPVGTDADRLRARYKAVGEAQKHVFGEGLPGSTPPDFNRKPPPPPPAPGPTP